MFYSHQLLARKAPLGQIWMAATLHAKINRKRLNKLNIIQICEEILNPSVPMALRLSGILMGGVVIVYERKVKLLYDDVSRLLVEINEAWKLKTVAADPTILPKGKTQAKYEAVTLKDNGDTDVGEIEQSLHFSTTTAFHATSFFAMGLEDVGETYIHIDPEEGDIGQHHQADAANITLFDDFGSYRAETNVFNRFERFDIEGEEETLNFTPQEYPQVPTTLVPSPPKEQPPEADEIHEAQRKSQDEQPTPDDENRAQEAEQNLQRQLPTKGNARRRPAHVVMDNELTIIPGHVFQCWLQNASDISSRRRKKGWQKHNQLFSMKINNLMELPPVALVSGLENATGEVHYPAPLMEQWAKCTLQQPSPDSPSLITTRLHPSEPSSSSSSLKRRRAQDPPEFPVGDFQSGIGSQEQQISIEKLRANLDEIEQIAVVDALKRNQFATPGSSEHSARSIPSSGSGHSLLQFDPEIQLPSGRLRKRQHSSSGHSLGGLDPVEEDIPWQQNGRDPKLRRLSENGTTPDFELLEETAPTQTPMPAKSPLMNEITRSIQTQLKVHFDKPGAPQVESLNQLAFGMTRRKAALLFYQTCVLASTDYLRVEQRVAYEDISISRGPKM